MIKYISISESGSRSSRFNFFCLPILKVSRYFLLCYIDVICPVYHTDWIRIMFFQCFIAYTLHYYFSYLIWMSLLALNCNEIIFSVFVGHVTTSDWEKQEAVEEHVHEKVRGAGYHAGSHSEWGIRWRSEPKMLHELLPYFHESCKFSPSRCITKVEVNNPEWMGHCPQNWRYKIYFLLWN